MKPAAQRKAVERARQLFGSSERRACTIFGVDRTSVRYTPRRSDDGDLRSRLREIAAERRRFGYRRLGRMLAREGLVMNRKKLLRLYREENLRVRRRRGRKRAMGIDLEALGGAADSADAAKPLHLSGEDAEIITARLLTWEPSSAREEFASHDREEAFGRAHALARAVLPALSETGVTDELVEQVFAMVRRAPAFLEALPMLVRRHPASVERAYREIRRVMGSRDVHIAYSAWRAIYTWMKLDHDGALSLPMLLPADVAASVAARRGPALLPALQRAEELISGGRMDDRCNQLLVEALEVLHSDTAYANQEREGLRADTLTLVLT